MTIDFRKNHVNAIYLNNQLKLIASNGRMITTNDSEHLQTHKKNSDLATNLFNFLSNVNPDRDI